MKNHGVAGLPARLGQLLTAPRAALANIEAVGGGVRDALFVTVLGVIGFRFLQLTEALLGLTQPSQGAFLRVVAVFANEFNDAVMVVIPAALGITVLAGRRRQPSLDLELGAACYTAFFLVRGGLRAANALALTFFGGGPLPSVAGYLPALVMAAVVFARALGLTRARPLPPPPLAASDQLATGEDVPSAPATTVPPVPPDRAAFAAGSVALAVVGLALIANGVWASRHMEALQPMKQGRPAPDFSLPSVVGGAPGVTLSNLRGKVVLLDFWATWCGPCRQMIPLLDAFYAEWAPRGVELVGVNSDGGQADVEEIRAFLKGHPARYPMVVDDGRANALYRVRALPQLVLIGRDGTVRQTFLGLTSRGDLDSAVARALTAPQ